jgi:hypothetical protein
LKLGEDEFLSVSGRKEGRKSIHGIESIAIDREVNEIKETQGKTKWPNENKAPWKHERKRTEQSKEPNSRTCSTFLCKCIQEPPTLLRELTSISTLKFLARVAGSLGTVDPLFLRSIVPTRSPRCLLDCAISLCVEGVVKVGLDARVRKAIVADGGQYSTLNVYNASLNYVPSAW